MDSQGDPPTTERRDDDTVFAPPAPRRSRVIAALQQAVSAREVAIAVAGIALTALSALGFSIRSPGKQIAAVNARVDTVQIHQVSTDAAIEVLKRRQDTLATGQAFANYLLCVQMRRNDPAAVPPDCAPTESRWMERSHR